MQQKTTFVTVTHRGEISATRLPSKAIKFYDFMMPSMQFFFLFPRRLTFLIFRADFSNSLTCLMVQGASRAGRPCRVMGHSGVALQFSPGCAVDLMRGKEIL